MQYTAIIVSIQWQHFYTKNLIIEQLRPSLAYRLTELYHIVLSRVPLTK